MSNKQNKRQVPKTYTLVFQIEQYGFDVYYEEGSVGQKIAHFYLSARSSKPDVSHEFSLSSERDAFVENFALTVYHKAWSLHYVKKIKGYTT